MTRHIGFEPIIEPRDRMRSSEVEAIANRLGKRRRSQHGMPKLLGQSLQPRRLVDGAADDGEVQPLVGADIAVHHFSDVQGNADLQGPAGRIQGADIPQGPHRGGQRAFPHIDVAPRAIRAKDPHDGVADELQDFAARCP